MTAPTIGQSLQGIIDQGQPQPTPTGQLLPSSQPVLTQQGPKLVELVTGLDLSPFLKLFIYGSGGSGKTLFAATAPNPLLLDTENSSDTLRDWPKIAANCKIVRMKWNHTDETIRRIKEDPDWADRETIVLDTVDALQRNNLEAILKGSNRDQFLPMEHDYKKSAEMLRRFILDLRDLDKHVIVLAHTTELTPEGTSLRLIRPGVTPKLAKTLTEEFSFVGYMAIKSDGAQMEGSKLIETPFENVMQSRGGSPTIDVKSRFKHLPSVLPNPTFRQIYDAANKYKETD